MRHKGENGDCVDGDGNDRGNDDDAEPRDGDDGDDGDELANEGVKWETDVDQVMLRCVVSCDARAILVVRSRDE